MADSRLLAHLVHHALLDGHLREILLFRCHDLKQSDKGASKRVWIAWAATVGKANQAAKTENRRYRSGAHERVTEREEEEEPKGRRAVLRHTAANGIAK